MKKLALFRRRSHQRAVVQRSIRYATLVSLLGIGAVVIHARAEDANDFVVALGYDAVGNLAHATQGGVQVETTYDRLNHISSRVVQTDTGAVSTEVREWDGSHALRSIADARGIKTLFSYGFASGPVREVSPDRGETTRAYDDSDRLGNQFDGRGRAVGIEYQSNGMMRAVLHDGERVVQIDTGVNVPGSPQWSASLPTLVRDGAGQTLYTYDGFGRVTAKHTTDTNGVAYQVAYRWGQEGNGSQKLQAVTYPSRQRVEFSYSNAGLPQGIRVQLPNAAGVYDGALVHAVVRDLAYAANGTPAAWTWGMGGHTYARGIAVRASKVSLRHTRLAMLCARLRTTRACKWLRFRIRRPAV